MVGRFINGDKIIDIRSCAFTNQFVYCHNTPINKVEIGGAFAITIFGITIAGAALAKLITVAVISVVALIIVSTPGFQRAWEDMCIDFINGIKAIGSGLKKCAENITTAISKSLEKAKIRERTTKTERHHIVPKNHTKTKQAISLMESVGIDRNSQLNLIDINYYLHKHLHTNLYLTSVNSAVVQAYSKGTSYKKRKQNITNFLLEMKSLFVTLNKILK